MVNNTGFISRLGATTQLVDGTDAIHTGIIKTLNASMGENRILSGCNITQGTSSSHTSYLISSGTFLRNGKFQSISSSTVTTTSSTGTPNSVDWYGLLVIQANNTFAWRHGTSSGKGNTSTATVAELTVGDIPIAMIQYDKDDAANVSNRKVQYLTYTQASRTFSAIDSGAETMRINSDGTLTKGSATITLPSTTGTLARTADVAYSSAISTGNNGLVPSAGTAGHFLKHDGTFGIPAYIANTDTNTQNEYVTSFVDSSDDILLRLTESGAGSGTQDIKFVSGSNITLTHTDANNITIASTDTNTQLTLLDEDNMASDSATAAASQQSIKAYVDSEVSGLIDSSPSALNTLNELAAALGDDANFATTTSTALGNRLRIDSASQNLTATQKSNAITNLGLGAASTLGTAAIADGGTGLATADQIHTFVTGLGYTTSSQISTEAVQDIVGAMFTSNTETRVGATYDDTSGKINVVVDDMTTDTNKFLSGLSLSGGTITATVTGGSNQTLDISAINTDTNTNIGTTDIISGLTALSSIDIANDSLIFRDNSDSGAVKKLSLTELMGAVTESLIPSLSTAKITSGTFATARIPTLAQSKITSLTSDLAAKVPTSRTIAGKSLSNNLTLVVDTAGKLAINDGGTAVIIQNSAGTPADVIFDNSKITTTTLGLNNVANESPSTLKTTMLLNNVDNKSASTLQSEILTAASASDVGLGNVTNESKATMFTSPTMSSPTFTGTLGGVLSNVDNTADTAKPVSTAQQTALDLKANLASPTFTGTVSGITKAMVGLTNVSDITTAAMRAGVTHSDVGTTASDVGLGSAASDITTNATNIATNVTNVATNATNIATNAGNIFGGAFSNLTSKPTTLAGYGITDALAGTTAVDDVSVANLLARAGDLDSTQASSFRTAIGAGSSVDNNNFVSEATFASGTVTLERGSLADLTVDISGVVPSWIPSSDPSYLTSVVLGASNITGATSLADNALVGADSILIHDATATALRELTITQLTSYFNDTSVLSNLAPIAQLTASEIDAMTIDSDTVGGFTVGKNVPSDAVLTDTVYSLTNDLASTEITAIQNIDTTTISETQWGYLGAATGAITNTDSSVSKANLTAVLETYTGDDTLNIGDSHNDTTINIKGNLNVLGTTTTLNKTEIDVQDALVFSYDTDSGDEKTTLRITEPTANRTVTIPDADFTIPTQDTTYSAASTSAAGLMSTAHFDILDDVTTIGEKIVATTTPSDGVSGFLRLASASDGTLSTSLDTSTYLTSFTESNDLSVAVTWANVPNVNITKASVAQHFDIDGNDAVKYLKMTTNSSGVVDFTARSASDMLSDLGAQAAGSYLTSVDTADITNGAVTLAKLQDIGASGANSLILGRTVNDTGSASAISAPMLGVITAANQSAAITAIGLGTAILDGDFSGTNTGILTRTGVGTYGVDTSTYITDYTVTQSDVTTHQAALSITESQISDLTSRRTQEEIEDFVGGMLDGTETFITVGYDDNNGNLDFVVPVKDEDAMTSNSANHLVTQQSIVSYVGTQISNLVDSSPDALNTLNELAAALGDDASFSTTMATSLGNRLRVDVNSQSLNSTQQTNALANLGATNVGIKAFHIADPTTGSNGLLRLGKDGSGVFSATLDTTIGTAGSVSSGMLADDAVGFTKMQNIGAGETGNIFLGRLAATEGVIGEVNAPMISVITAANSTAARTALGASTVGANLFTLTNPSTANSPAVPLFTRLNANNTVSALSASDFRTAIGASASGASNFGVGDITGATEFDGTLVDTDELIFNDGGVLSRMDFSVLKSNILSTANVTSAGALMDSELTAIAHVKALNQSVVSGATPTFTTTYFTSATDKNLITDAQVTAITNSVSSLSDLSITATAAEINILASGLADADIPQVLTLTELVSGSLDVALSGINGVTLKNSDTGYLNIDVNGSGHAVIKSPTDAKEIIFQQYDGTEVARIKDNATFDIPASKLSIAGTAVTSTAANLNLLSGLSSLPNLSTEQVQDIVGGMLVGTETRIGVSYDDTNGRINFVVDDMTANTQLSLLDQDNMSSNSATAAASQQSIKAYVDTEIAGLVDSAPSTLNTLNELALAIQGNDADVTTITTALGNRLRVDVNSQGLNSTQQGNALTNLGISASLAEINILGDGLAASNIPTLTASKITEISNLTAVEGEQLENIGTTTISAAQWGYLGAATGAITNTDTVYTHPTHNGDDISIDTGALTGATVISDLDFNVTTDTLGHVTDANATIATRTLTLANLGFTGDTDATDDLTAAEIRTLVGTGNSGVLPAAGTSGHFLKHDGTFGALPAKMAFTIRDGSDTDVIIPDGRFIKFNEGNGLDITFTDTDTGDTNDPFDLTFKVADDGIGAAQLANTAVTAGSYTNASITVDAQGRLTSASSGAAAGDVTLSGAQTFTGVKTFSAVAKLSNGSVSAPALSFSAQTNQGMYRIGGGSTGFTSSGQLKLTVDPYGITVGDGNSAGYVNAKGTQDLILRTNNGTNSGVITLADGANNDIDINPHGTGKIRINTTSNDGVKLDVRGNNNETVANLRNQTSATNAAQTVLQLIAGTSGTAAAGLGAKLQFRQGDDGYAGYTAGSIYSSRVDNSNHHLYITPEGTGDLVLDGLKWPQADGSANQVLKTDGSAQLSWTTVSGGASAIDGLSDGFSGWGDNVGLGNGALDSTTENQANRNTAVGVRSLTTVTIGDDNTAVGYEALKLTSGGDNTALGKDAGKNISSGSRNLAIGSLALDAATSENDNLAIGYSALGGSVSGGDKNVMIGNYAGDSLSSGTENVGVGYQAHTGGSGFFNVAVGSQAGKLMTSNSYQTLVGYQAGQSFNGANAKFNTAIGYQAMGGGTSSPHQNTALGAGALYNVNGVSRNNIGIGYQAGVNQTAGSGNVIIGSGVDVASTTGSRQLAIAGNDGSTTTTWITGDSDGNVKGTDFYMVAEWNDQYFTDALRNGKRFSFGAGMNNNTNSDSGTIGTETILPRACTLEEMHFWIGNVGAETGSGNFTIRLDKNGSELATDYTFNMSGSGGNHVQKSFTPNVSFDAGETFNLTLHDAATSGYGSQNQIGRVRVTFRFRTNN